MKNNNASDRHLPGCDELDIAERKLRRLFLSFGIDAELQRDRLIDPYIKRAAQYGRRQSEADLARLTIDEVNIDLGDWFNRLLDDRLGGLDSPVMVGRAAFWMCGGPDKWQDQLLRSPDALDASFVMALRESAPNAVPPSDAGDMHHQAYEAWSPTAALARALPVDRGLFSSFQSLFWRGTDTTS